MWTAILISFGLVAGAAGLLLGLAYFALIVSGGDGQDERDREAQWLREIRNG